MTLKYCEFCKKNITRQNFTTHKHTVKHQKNKANYKEENLLDLEKDELHDIKYYKTVLLDIKNNIETILNKDN